MYERLLRNWQLSSLFLSFERFIGVVLCLITIDARNSLSTYVYTHLYIITNNNLKILTAYVIESIANTALAIGVQLSNYSYFHNNQ